MKAFIIYHGEPNAGILETHFELDLGDMFENGFKEEGPEYRELVRDALRDLAYLANDIPDSVIFEDENNARNKKIDDDLMLHHFIED